MNFKFSILLPFFILILSLQGNSQNGTTTAGETVTNESYQIGYAIGESIISNYSNEGVIVTNGIIQPIDNNSSSSKEVSISKIKVFPNPTGSILKIEPNGENFLSFEVFNMDGKRLLNGKIGNNNIDLKNLPTGSYILQLNSPQLSVNSLIQKIESK